MPGPSRLLPPVAPMHPLIFELTQLGAGVRYQKPSFPIGRPRRGRTRVVHRDDSSAEVEVEESTEEQQRKRRKKQSRGVWLTVKDDQGRKTEVRATFQS